ncbi:hypothetical protein QBC35DRAFT_449304 [Podospora australis]|uniref:Uncharacterized protein n=1 Tax=Podospora australis TaxID=1536484 RepID=A0AAN6X364_9PEZI|nr:hypothetical protein QBC35DRAFT_449304 [Podospora australis]
MKSVNILLFAAFAAAAPVSSVETKALNIIDARDGATPVGTDEWFKSKRDGTAPVGTDEYFKRKRDGTTPLGTDEWFKVKRE